MTIDNMVDFEEHNSKELRTLSQQHDLNYLDVLVENIRMRGTHLTAYCIKHQHIPDEQEEVVVYLDVLKTMKEQYNNGM